ncbi:MAG: hypothetical protein ACREPA_05500 [Candidatus Dormibacteraceae bacterium]
MSSAVEMVALSSIVPPENHEVGGDFDAVVDGQTVRVRAVLERTAVIEHLPRGERVLVRKDACLVEPRAVAFVAGNPSQGVGPRQWRRLPGRPPKPEAPKPEPSSPT